MKEKGKKKTWSLLRGNNIGLSYHQKLFYECKHLDRKIHKRKGKMLKENRKNLKENVSK